MPRRAAIGTTVIVMTVIVVTALASVGVFVMTNQVNPGGPAITVSTASMTSNYSADSSVDTTASGSPSTVCIVPVEGAGADLRIVSDSSGQPLPGIPVSVLPTADSCFGTYAPTRSAEATNDNGWISIEGMQANYYFEVSVEYAGRTYNFSLPQGPLDMTNATLSLPSGDLSVSLCSTMGQGNACSAYTESTTTSASTRSAYGGLGVSSPLRSSIECGDWNFTAVIDTNSATLGQPIRLTATLTNVGMTSVTINDHVEPYINPAVYATNGTQIWAWDPSQVTLRDWSMSSGEKVSQAVTIPTSGLAPGQNYLIRVLHSPCRTGVLT